MQTLTSKHTHNKRHTRTLTDKICCHIPSCFLSTEGDDRKLSPAKSAGLMYIPTSPSLYTPLPLPRIGAVNFSPLPSVSPSPNRWPWDREQRVRAETLSHRHTTPHTTPAHNFIPLPPRTNMGRPLVHFGLAACCPGEWEGDHRE